MATTFLRPVFRREEFTRDDEGTLVPFRVVAKGERVWGLLFIGKRGEVVSEDRREQSRILSNRLLWLPSFSLSKHVIPSKHFQTDINAPRVATSSVSTFGQTIHRTWVDCSK